MTDPYSVLGLEQTASDEEVTRAYRALARKYHPDLHPGDKSAELKMKNLNAAYMQIQDMRSGKSARSTAGWGGSDAEENQSDNTYQRRTQTGNYSYGYGGFYGNFTGFGNNNYNTDSDTDDNHGYNQYYGRPTPRRRGGLFGFSFVRVIMAIIILRFVLNAVFMVFSGFSGYQSYPEPAAEYSSTTVYDQSNHDNGGGDFTL